MEGGSTQSVMGVFYDPEPNDCVEFEDYYENSKEKSDSLFLLGWDLISLKMS